MYSTCLFCNNTLGSNESIEHFPVGSRIAFDAATGRLWVVCRKCERWNLSPLESRWEAIEEAERAFRSTKLRVSTDNIGMAQLKDGTELVRIGKPIRTEFAAWRYGDQFGRRWRKYAAGSAAVAAAPVGQLVYHGINIGSWLTHTYGNELFLPFTLGGTVVLGAGTAVSLFRNYRDRRIRVSIRDDNGTVLHVPRFWMNRSAIVPATGERGLSLGLMHLRALQPGHVTRMQGDPVKQQHITDVSLSNLTGENALRALSTILPHINRDGGTARTVSRAVDSITQANELSQIVSNAPVRRWSQSIHTKRWERNISTLPASIRLALEMSLHETDERRAMEGELHVLEQRWKEADAIGKIADEMFLPENIDECVRHLTNKKESDD
ncbi:MAG: hypothetical protein ABI852_00600 [Gemmatimonadaceae bacterium]